MGPEKHSLPDGGEDRARDSTVRARVLAGPSNSSDATPPAVPGAGQPEQGVSAQASTSGREGSEVRPGQKFSKGQVQIAVFQWLDAYDNGHFKNSRSLRQLKTLPKGAAHPIRWMLRWTKLVEELCAIPQTDGTAPPAGRYVKLTQMMIGDYINRSADWVRDAAHVRALVVANNDHEALRKTLRSWDRARGVVGMKRLLGLCTRAIETNVPDLAPGVGDEEDDQVPETYDPAAPDAENEETDDFERALLGRHSAPTARSD